MIHIERAFYRIIYPLRWMRWFLLRPRSTSVKCLIECKGHFLFIRNSYGKGYWTFPGGRVKTWFEEVPIHAAKREMKEEVGIIVNENALIPIGEYVTTRRYKRDTVICFYTEVAKTIFKISSFDVREARWFPKDALPEDLSFAVRDVLVCYSSYLEKKQRGLETPS